MFLLLTPGSKNDEFMEKQIALEDKLEKQVKEKNE